MRNQIASIGINQAPKSLYKGEPLFSAQISNNFTRAKWQTTKELKRHTAFPEQQTKQKIPEQKRWITFFIATTEQISLPLRYQQTTSIEQNFHFLEEHARNNFCSSSNILSFSADHQKWDNYSNYVLSGLRWHQDLPKNWNAEVDC